MAKVKKKVYGQGGEYDLIDYQSLSNEALLDKDPLTLEQAKELLYLYNEDAEIYRDEIEECSDVDELADLVYENNLGTIENTYNFSWWGGVRQYIIVHNFGSKFDFDDPTMIFMSRQTGGGDVRGGYEKYEAFDYDKGYIYEDFAIISDRLTYDITTDDGKKAKFDTEDMEGYSLYVVEDETGTFEADDTTDVDEVAKAFDIDDNEMYAKGGRLKSFLGKAKEVGGKAYAKGKEKARELAHKTKEKAKEKIHNAKRSTTTQVLRETKGGNYDTTYEERNTLDEASDIVNDNYKYTPIPYVPKKEMGGEIDEGYTMYEYILEGSEATMDNAYDSAESLDWGGMETYYVDKLPKNREYIDTINGIDIYHDYGADYYFFTDEVGFDHNIESSLSSSNIFSDDNEMYAKGGGVDEYVLPKHLKKKLDRVNKHLNKFGGRSLTEKEAIRFNIDNNAESGFQAGSIAFDISDAPDEYNGLSYHKASTRYYHWIGDALIEISEVVTGVPYDSHNYEIERIIENSPYKKMANGGGVDIGSYYFKDTDGEYDHYEYVGYSGELDIRAEEDYGDGVDSEGNKMEGYYFLDTDTGYTETFDTEAQARRGLKKYMKEVGYKVVSKKKFYELAGWDINDNYAKGGEIEVGKTYTANFYDKTNKQKPTKFKVEGISKSFRDGSKFIDVLYEDNKRARISEKDLSKVMMAKGGEIKTGAYILRLYDDAFDNVIENGYDSMQDYLDDLNERGVGYAEYEEGYGDEQDAIYTHSEEVIDELGNDGIAYQTYSSNYAKGGRMAHNGKVYAIVTEYDGRNDWEQVLYRHHNKEIAEKNYKIIKKENPNLYLAFLELSKEGGVIDVLSLREPYTNKPSRFINTYAKGGSLQRALKRINETKRRYAKRDAELREKYNKEKFEKFKRGDAKTFGAYAKGGNISFDISDLTRG